MLRACRRRTLAHWATLVAWVLATLAPAVSQALQATRGELAPWSVICSADAERRGAPSDRTDEQSDLAHLFQHCPFCATSQPVLGLPPAAPVVRLTRMAVDDRPAPRLAGPNPLFAWASAQPRAPPQDA